MLKIIKSVIYKSYSSIPSTPCRDSFIKYLLY